ncbi:MAG: glycoside hydrolase family 88 protein [Lewinellaceae bacterium]|nr:glycoside hydrolase family 88 protein [Lewinellaceae bacterium]
MKFISDLSMPVKLLGLLAFLIGVVHCKPEKATNSTTAKIQAMTVNIPEGKPWSERMALSVMKRAPEAWMNDFQKSPRWTYTIGLVLNAVNQVADAKNNPVYFEYARGYADTMILADGTIRDYDLDKFNIDNIAPGPYLMSVYQKTKEERLKTAMNTLMYQLKWQPQTTDGGYWHKLRYPWQMWLDGLFMGEPFQAEYAAKFDRPELFDHIARQFILAEKHTRDPGTGLLYHAWDESRVQRWSNPETGCSGHLWGRADGWYCMGLVEVLDFFPKDHPQREELIAILNRTLEAVVKVRDPETHTWWQVLNLPERKGNYLESTASCMFTYAMIKGVNEGYLDQKYRAIARESYDGILKTFIKVDGSGEVHLTNCCSVAGLGGDPYRDGSFEYYISEPIRDNDPKGIGPFIMASLEFEKNRTMAN